MLLDQREIYYLVAATCRGAWRVDMVVGGGMPSQIEAVFTNKACQLACSADCTCSPLHEKEGRT